MGSWKKWVWTGLLVTVILSSLAGWFLGPAIQAELTEKSRIALVANGHSWANVELDVRDLTLSGVAPNPEAGKLAEDLARNTDHIRTVNNLAGLLPLQSAYNFSASIDDKQLVLNGFVPDEQSRSQILDIAGKVAAKRKVVDQLKFARGAPDDFANAATFSLSQLDQFTKGSVKLSAGEISVEGTASSVETFKQAILGNDGILPKGFKIAKNKISPPPVSPYIWTAKLEGTAVTLSGLYPDKPAHDEIVEFATKSNPGREIKDQMIPASGAPDDFGKATEFGLSLISKMTDGQYNLNAQNITVSGNAISLQTFEQIKTALSDNVPSGYQLVEQNIGRAIVSPFTWSATLKDNSISLGGYAPSEVVRTTLIDAAKELNPGKEIIDHLKITAGEPKDFASGARYNLSLLSHLSEGQASLSDTDISIKGSVSDFASFDALVNTLKSDVPTGYKVVDQAVSRPVVSPFVWSLSKKQNSIEISGFVPNPKARTDIAKSAEKQNPDVKIKDKTKIAGGAPENFVNAAQFALSLSPHTDTVKIELNQSKISITGTAKSAAGFQQLREQIKTVPTGFTIASNTVSNIIISPYVWTVIKTPGEISLSGFAPTQEEKDRLRQLAEEKNVNSKTVDEVKIADGASDNYRQSTEFALARLAELENGVAKLTDDSLDIRGTATDVKSYAAAILALKTLPEGIKLARAQIIPPTVSPYELTVLKSENTISLSGVVPDEETRNQLLEATKKHHSLNQVTDNLWIALGVPEGVSWGVAGSFAIAQLGELSSGSTKILLDKFHIQGPAKSPISYDVVTKTIASGLEGGLKPGDIAIGKPIIKPYTWTIERDHITVILDGYAPDDQAIDANIVAIKNVLGTNTKVTNLQKTGGGAPKGFLATTSIAINIASRLENSKAVINSTKLTVTGEALSELAAEKIRVQVANALPPGFSGEANITVREVQKAQIVEPDICQNLLNNLQRFTIIQFDLAKYDIKEESFGLLDRLVFAAKRCPQSRIAVEGHADSDGGDDFNQQLSESRAIAVRDYLTTSGVSSLRIETLGFGEKQPIADNISRAGRAQNRRIEFRVLQ